MSTNIIQNHYLHNEYKEKNSNVEILMIEVSTL
jgi:hypothetical protein